MIPDELNDIDSYKIINQFDTSKPIDIVFRINCASTNMEIVLRQDGKEVKASNVNIKVFEKN